MCSFPTLIDKASKVQILASQVTHSQREPHLNRLVTVSTGQTINPGLDIAPTGRYQIYQDPRATPEDWTLNLLGVYKPDGKAVGTIFIQNPGCASYMDNT